MGRLGILLLLGAALAAAERVPRLEPLSGFPPHPSDNPGTPEKVKLGEMLFFERMLSGARGRSCATCHKPELLFADGHTRGWGLHDAELRFKTPSLLNVGWQRSLFSDGRVKSLEEQVAFPLRNRREMDIDPERAAERIRRDPAYAKIFSDVFPGEPVTFDLIAKAIVAFERTLVSYDSDLDRYLLGDETALAPPARRGMELFTGKAGCIRCHHGPLLTDHKLHYTGVPESTGSAKPGKKYKTAGLRDVARRSSFMHNGHYLRLEHVMQHYIRGGAAPDGLQSEIRPISLNDHEKADLYAFLKGLNGRVSAPADPPQLDLRRFKIKTGVPPESESSGPKDPSYVNK